MKSYKAAIALMCALVAVSCSGPVARIDGTLEGAPSKEVIVKMLNVNTESVLDTVKTDAAGRFSYKVSVAEGQPEFVYLYYSDTRLSSLLLEAGDKVTVTLDTLGASCTVEGSEQSILLQEREAAFAAFLRQMASTDDTQELTKAYVQYYRDAVKYVMANPFSLTVVPVLFGNVNPDFPVFSQQTDALHFRAAADSLKKVYPESRYVKALETETARREKLLSLSNQISLASEANFPDIISKDINGQDVSLSGIDAKAILIHFWTASDASSKIMNLDSLMPLYEKYHSKGLEILQVSLDTDKAFWAGVVKSQQLPWINVNDGLGTASQAALLYNISTLPQSFLIVDGHIYDKPLTGDDAIRRELDRVLR